MGNTQASRRRSSQQRRSRPNSIAGDKFERHSQRPDNFQRSSSVGGHSSVRRRYSGGYGSFKTPWPLPQSEAVFLPEYDTRPPVKFTDFEIMANVGKGAHGHILQVKKRNSEKVYAMKILNKAEIIKENAVQQCKDEVNIQSKLGDFPFVVKIWYTWQTKHNLFIVTDFVTNGDLHTLWQQEKVLAEDSVRILVMELALTLDYIHKSDIIYRDLKMENVLLDDKGHVKLIDFGLSKTLGPRERTQTICGTLQTMAPEVLNGQKYTHSADWWSLGVLAYSLVTGQYPYQCTKEHLTTYQLVKGVEIEFPPHVSPEAKDLITMLVGNGLYVPEDAIVKLLQKNPRSRLSSLDAFESHPFFKGHSFTDVMERKAAVLSEKMVKALRRRSKSYRIDIPRMVEVQRGSARDKKARPLSWANPGSFTVHDRQQMDWLVADLGNLASLNIASSTSIECPVAS